jgi:hypothetical protein
MAMERAIVERKRRERDEESANFSALFERLQSKRIRLLSVDFPPENDRFAQIMRSPFEDNEEGMRASNESINDVEMTIEEYDEDGTHIPEEAPEPLVPGTSTWNRDLMKRQSKADIRKLKAKKPKLPTRTISRRSRRPIREMLARRKALRSPPPSDIETLVSPEVEQEVASVLGFMDILAQRDAPPICSICRNDSPLDRELPCGHKFHNHGCLKPWLKRSGTCPNCRKIVELEDLEPDEIPIDDEEVDDADMDFRARYQLEMERRANSRNAYLILMSLPPLRT